MEMKEIHDAALAYYKNLSDELQQKAKEEFKEMDSNGNGTISSDEFLRSMEISSEIKRCFKLLDKSGDGNLDFDEFITLYYLVESGRGVFCRGNGCKASPLFNGLYFTCVECFDNNEAETFNLCTSCYGDLKYVHDHANFLDNYVLLRSKAASECPKAIDGDEPNPAKSDQGLIGRGLEMALGQPEFGTPRSPRSGSKLSESDCNFDQVGQRRSKRPNPAKYNRVIGRGLEMASDLLGQPEFGTPISPRSGSKLSESDCNFDQVGRPRSKRRPLVEAFKSLKAHVGDQANILDNYVLLGSKAACESTKAIDDEVEEMGKEIVRQDSLTRPEKRWLSFYKNLVLMENTGTNKLEDIVVKMPELDEISLTAKSFSKATSTDWTFLRIALCLEIMSLCFDQLSSPSKPTYALFGMLLAIAALLNCICELIHKGIKERVELRARSCYVLFCTLPDFYGLVAGIFQCICSTIQYVYFIRHDKNPIKVSLLPTIFVICLAVSRVNWNRRDETIEQND